MNKIDKKLLEQIADLHSTPTGVFNIRKNGEAVARHSDAEIEIVPKKGKSGIDIIVKKGVKNKSVHIPVIVTKGGFNDLVYNTFYIGDDADVVIIAGCGIDNPTCHDSEHNGIHTFYVGKNAHVKYVEKHFGSGIGKGGKILNPVTNLHLGENSFVEIDTLQIGGVDSSLRTTNATLDDKAKLVIKENILTTDNQQAKTKFKVNLKGKDCSVEVVSHSVAKDNSKQEFLSNLVGENECFGHVECDGILLGDAQMISIPKITAKCVEASLVHEAAIGKIAGDELVKLMTLGLSQEEAEKVIIQGFLMG